MARIRSNTREFLAGGGDELVRTALRRALRPRRTDGAGETRRYRLRITEIEKKIDRLLDNLSATTKEFIDRKVAALTDERDDLAARLKELEQRKHAVVDVEAFSREIVELIGQFDDVFAEGTIEEQKEFIRLFVEGIEVDPKERRAKVRIRKFPAPGSLDAGKLSFQVVAGARSEHQKTPFPPVDVVEIPLERRGNVLVPVAA